MPARPVRTPRLILVDGFAGSGKSTTAQRVWLRLAARGRQATWFHEHQRDHPIFRYHEVEELLALKAGPFEEEILANWRAFARADDGVTIRILEGSLFQITVGVLLSLNAEPRRIVRTLLEIERLVGGLAPALVYLFDRRTRDGLLRIRQHRGDYWLTGMTTIVGQSAYGRRHRVRDVEGLIAFYEQQRVIVDAARVKLRMRQAAIEIGRGRWPDYERRIAAFLNLGRDARRPLPPDALLGYAGRYATAKAGRGLLVTTDATSLYREEPLLPAQRLLPVTGGRFCVESLPIELRFKASGGRRPRVVTVENRLMNAPAAGTTFIRRAEARSSR